MGAYVTSVMGHGIDTSGQTWRLDDQIVFNLPRVPAIDAQLAAFWDGAREFLRSSIPVVVPGTVFSLYNSIKQVLTDAEGLDLLKAGGVGILGKLHVRFMEDGGNLQVARHNLSRFRQFYGWCADQGLEGFDPEVAFDFERTVIKGPRSGRAVLRKDPRCGPLTEREAEALEDGLWEAWRTRSLPLTEIAAAMLMLYYGPNPENLRRLQERDLVPPENRGDEYLLRMPRIKKANYKGWRGDFKPRAVTPELAEVIQALIDENRAAAPPEDPAQPEFERPLFRRKRVNADLLGTDLHAGAFRIYTQFFSVALKSIAEKLDLRGRDGNRLHLHPRRLRYTFAKRQVDGGVEKFELMELLDHSDLKSILIYYQGGMDMVPAIDKAMGSAMTILCDLSFGRTTTAAFANDPVLAKFIPSPLRTRPPAPFACLSCRYLKLRDGAAILRVIDHVERRPALSRVVDRRAVSNAREAAARCGAGDDAARPGPKTSARPTKEAHP